MCYMRERVSLSLTMVIHTRYRWNSLLSFGDSSVIGSIIKSEIGLRVGFGQETSKLIEIPDNWITVLVEGRGFSEA